MCCKWQPQELCREVWLLWWATAFVWKLLPLGGFVWAQELLLACLAPRRAASQALGQWQCSSLLLLSLLGQQCPDLSRPWLRKGAWLLFEAHWEENSWVRGGWPGWLQGQGAWHLQIGEICSNKVLLSGKVSLGAHHISLKIAEQWEMPSCGPDVLFCAKEHYWYEMW